ncbi:MAG: hybrid sensor histidine kinase/response regulator, partial [Desulfobacca sp.]|nr:hybrid sensor histidine kinase/response regulator [Desulfobacca sp.]
LLSVILGNLELIKLFDQSGESLTNSVEAAMKAGLEARGLTQQLITLAQGGDPVKKLTSLSGLLQEQVTFALRGSQVTCKFSIPDDLWPVEVDGSQIGQVIRNIVLNAREAMAGGGTILILAENIELTLPSNLPLPPGDYIKTSISDHGKGIPEDILPKIFDPYFSTKQRGNQKGMGLGLTICRSIIQKHGGAITVETTLDLYLPALRAAISELPALSGGILWTARILVMDDEEMIRTLSESTLRQLGFDVELAENGERAIERYQAAKDLGHPFDAVILDLTIRGGMGGKETIQELLKIDPNVKAIVFSGYSNDPVIQDYEKYGFKGALKKPFLIRDLNNTLSKVLGSDKTQEPHP